jgi:hypothetical protein
MALNFIKASGNIITEDFCNSLAIETKADYVKDKSFGDSVKKIDEIIATTFEKLRERWEENRTSIINNSFDNSNLRQKWIIPFLKELGFDPIFIASNIKSASGIEYQIPYKAWDADFAPLIQMVNSSQDLDDKDRNSRTHSNKSPQDCLQQFLNTSDHQWAILTNGKKIRIVRDFYHSITKGFLEFDLEGIFETANSEQYRVLYRILHKSRFDNQYQGATDQEFDEEGNLIENPNNCLLELFHKKAKETGIKVGNKLREQVINSIELLGNGFAENLNPDDFQNGQVKAYYAEILNIIYRLLFLMFAEQKGWLPVRNSIYARTYSINSLKERAARGNYSHDEEIDIWEGLKITFKLVTKGYKFKNGEKVNAFGGQLFSDRKVNTVIHLKIKNKFLLDAIYQLSFFKSENLVNKINYANLAIDELGSVYESLLDYEPKLASESITIGNKQINRGEFYLDDRGTDRKTSGSYYTDSRLVAQLIDSALVPVIENAINSQNTQQNKEVALLNLKVADIACGSGAFLCAALEKMGEYLAIIRMGDEDRPTDEQLREAKRDVLLHCIYGVDLNPMALELAKFSLWITASLPDMPLSFLDHKLKFGNSLIGATPDVLKQGIPTEAYKEFGRDNKETSKWLRDKVKKELTSLAKGGFQSTLDLRVGLVDSEEDDYAYLELLSNEQETPEEVEAAENEYHNIKNNLHHSVEWRLADAWTASFFFEKTDLQKQYPTNETLYNLRNGLQVNESLLAEIESLSFRYHFFHYHLEFPEVFDNGGFDCILGNPPWETVEFKTQEFFKTTCPEISEIKSTSKREIAISNLQNTNIELFNLFNYQSHYFEATKNFLKNSGSYPLTSDGKINLYSKFTEKIISISKSSGIIVQGDIATGFDTKVLFDHLVQNDLLAKFHHFHNKAKFFDIHRDTKFALLTIRKESKKTEFMFNISSYDEINDESRKINLSKSDIELINPNTKTAPIIRSTKDLNIIKKLYDFPVVHKHDFENVWKINNHRMINGSDDSKHLRLLNELTAVNGTSFMHELNGQSYLPVYESKLMWQYDHRYSTYEGVSNTDLQSSKPRNSTNDEKRDSTFEVKTKDYILENTFKEKYEKNYNQDWFIIYRNVTGALNQRTTVATIIPRLPVVLSAYILNFDSTHSHTDQVLFLANINSYVFDFISRRKIGGSHLSVYVFDQIPVIPPGNFSKRVRTEIKDRVLKLIYTSKSLSKFANDLGYFGEPFEWNEAQRLTLQLELDAIFFHLYELDIDDLDYIIESFGIIKKRDLSNTNHFYTKEKLIELFNQYNWIKQEKLTLK